MLQTLKNKSKRIASTLAAGVLLFSQFAVVPAASAHNNNNNDPSDKIAICHANNSQSNPYTTNSIDKSSADEDNNQYLNGHGDHTGPVWYPGIADHSWGDIIPPFTSDKGTVFPGRNWTTEGQAIYDNDCSVKNSITVVKDTQPNSTDDFSFTIKKGQSTVSSFSLEDDGHNNDGHKNNKTVSDLSDGTYVITEASYSDWVLNSITCDTNSTVDQANRKVTVPLGVAQNVTCTFVNVPTPTYGNVKVNKKLDSGNGTYTSANGDQYPFLWGLDSDATDNMMGSTQSSVLTGSHAINENTVNGYAFTGWYYTANEDNQGEHQVNCKNPQGTTLPVQITVEKNKTKELTFCNRVVKGSITVHKHTDPADDETEFAIEATTDNGTIFGNANRTITGGQSQVFEVGYGTYDIDESDLPAGWTQNSNTCAEIVINADNLSAECDIYNAKAAKLTIYKYTSPISDPQDFTFTSEKLGNFTLDNDNDPTLDNNKVFTSLTAGDYSVTEGAVNNWKLDYAYCYKNEDQYTSKRNGTTLTVTLHAGDDVTCYFHNSEQNTIQGHKFNDVNGNHKWDDGEPALAGWTIKLTKECVAEEEGDAVHFLAIQPEDDDCTPSEQTTVTNANGAYSFTNLEPGTYTVCEVQQDKWTQTYPQDNNGCHEIEVKAHGEVLTADFGNKAKPQVLSETTTTLVNTGASTGKGMVFGLVIFGALGALHMLTNRRKDYAQ